MKSMDESVYEAAMRVEELARQQAIDSRVQYQGESATECEECGDRIPERRRLAVKGTQLCACCAQALEAQHRRLKV
jgi:RNA polymerase-binding transcription factor DksA